MRKFTHIICLVLSTLLLTNSGANAQTRQCLALQKQLKELSLTKTLITKPAIFLKYKDAVRDQQSELLKAKRLARINGCRIRNKSLDICKSNFELIERMETNLASLKAKLQKTSSANANSTASQRANLQKRIKRLNCQSKTQKVRVNRGGKDQISIIDQIYGKPGAKTNPEQNSTNNAISIKKRPITGKTFRTMCVRTCDGYYFPISFSTNEAQFAQDADICAQRCPAAQTELYFHNVSKSDSEDMISHIDNFPYAEQDFAFKYRTQKVKNCSCGSASAPELFSKIAGTDLSLLPDDSIKDEFASVSEEERSQNFKFAHPSWRPHSMYSPEAIANISGDLTLESAKDLIRKTKRPIEVSEIKPISKEDSEGSIRVVGPQFFPDQ